MEGRQAVRELLIAGQRKVKEIWVSADPDESEVVGDIVDIAKTMRVTVTQVARKRLDMQARSEAPQGVIAFAAPLQEVELSTLLQRRGTRHAPEHHVEDAREREHEGQRPAAWPVREALFRRGSRRGRCPA